MATAIVTTSFHGVSSHFSDLHLAQIDSMKEFYVSYLIEYNVIV